MMITALLLSLVVTAQNAGDDCTATPDAVVCGGPDILYCDAATGEFAVFSCSLDGQVPGAACSPAGCSGACERFLTCEQARGGQCALLENVAMPVSCAAGDACTVDFAAQTQTCRASPIGACTQSGSRCVGDDAVLCLGTDEAFYTSPAVLQCGTDGGTCVETAEGATCLANTEPACAGVRDAQRCVDGARIICVDGVVETNEDCIARGQTCLIEDGAPVCVATDPACGPLGLGACTGNTATICSRGQVSSTLDCSTVGRRCGAIDDSGSIGCAQTQAAEGEGEPECADDADCDDDEECDDGECEPINSRARQRGEVVQPTSPFGCDAVPPGAVLWGVLGLLGLRRRSALLRAS